jgi:hypothetical protein
MPLYIPKILKRNWVWWCTSTIFALKRLRQEDLKFDASLGYIVRLSQK